MGKYTPNNPTIRILMLGSAGVGKNCLESRFTTMTYPPPYNPALTLNSRRFFTLLPLLPVMDWATAHPEEDAAPPAEEPADRDENDTKKGAAVTVSTVERTPTGSTNSSNRAADRRVAEGPTAAAAATTTVAATAVDTSAATNEDNADTDAASFDDRTLVASDTCSECLREHNTYLVEVINYPDLQNPKVRAQVHRAADYDAVLLVYDVGDRASFDAVRGLHAEIPVCTRRNHHHHHRRAAPHASATRSRTSGWFGGGGNEATGNTGSGEIVVGLVGNKSDVDRSAGEYINGDNVGESGSSAPQEKQKHQDDDERSLLHPLYRESIHYEELMAGLEEQERRAETSSSARAEGSSAPADRAAAAAAATRKETATPTTPFPTGEEASSSSMQARMDASKNDDIQKWLQMGRLSKRHSGNALPSPSSPTRRTAASPQKPTFGIIGDSGDDNMTAATYSSNAARSSDPAPSPTKSTHRQTKPAASQTQTRQRTVQSPRPTRQVPAADGAALAQALRLPVAFCETSAKTGDRVETAFEQLIREVLREMGRDASGANKAGKTCRHRAGGALPQQIQQKQQQQLSSPTKLHHQHHQHPSSPTKLQHNHHHHHHPHLPEHHHYEKDSIVPPVSAASGDRKSSSRKGSSVGKEPAGAIRVVEEIADQRPDSAAILELGKTASAEAEAGGSAVDESGDGPVITMPRPTHRRESMIGRMRKVFGRKQEAVMATDIAV